MKKLMMTIGTIVLVIIMMVPSTAQMRMRGDYGRGHYHALDITRLPDLNLTTAQIKQLDTLRDTHLHDIQPLRDLMYNKSMELKGLWLEQSPDHNKIAELQKEIQTLRDKMLEKIANYRLATQSILTAQQQATLEAYQAKRGYGLEAGRRDQGGMRRGMGREDF